VIALIGDGSLTGGLALEGLNHTGHTGKNLVIVVNDNTMSIAKNVGAMSSYLSRITATGFYQGFRRHFDNAVRKIPVIGRHIYNFVFRIKKGIKALLFKDSLFSDFGFEYVGPIDGHNIPLLIKVFRNVKLINKPVVVHVKTCKGKGYSHAEVDPTLYHGVSAFSIVDGKIEKKKSLTFTEAFSDTLLALGHEDRRIMAVTASMTAGTGLYPFQTAFPERFYDVGIAEEHAVTFSAGLAVSGLRPVVAIYSTFMQRAVDQVIHDVALPGLPVIIAMDRSGIVEGDGETHQGIFDIPLFRSIPGITMLCPATRSEMESCLKYALAPGTGQGRAGKVMRLRYPGHGNGRAPERGARRGQYPGSPPGSYRCVSPAVHQTARRGFPCPAAYLLSPGRDLRGRGRRRRDRGADHEESLPQRSQIRIQARGGSRAVHPSRHAG
jgi:1-deoxy-D-xylulose-5-phosphate synthase